MISVQVYVSDIIPDYAPQGFLVQNKVLFRNACGWLSCSLAIPETFLLQSLHYNCVVSLIVALQAVEALLEPRLALPQLLHLLQQHIQAGALAPLQRVAL